MAAAVGDGITIDNVIPLHLEAIIAKLREMGVKLRLVKKAFMYQNRPLNITGSGCQNIGIPWIPNGYSATACRANVTSIRFLKSNRYYLHSSF